jgi:hypothetical protein
MHYKSICSDNGLFEELMNDNHTARKIKSDNEYLPLRAVLKIEVYNLFMNQRSFTIVTQWKIASVFLVLSHIRPLYRI